MANLYPRPPDHELVELDLDRFGPGLHGYSPGDPLVDPPKPPTRVRAVFLNALIREYMLAITNSGQTPSDAIEDQLWQAIWPSGVGIYGTGVTQPANVDEAVIDGVSLLDRDTFARRLRITSTGHLRTDGWRLYVSDLMVIEAGGQLSHDGLRGQSGANGGAGGLGANGGPLRTLRGGAAGGAGTAGNGLQGVATDFSAGGHGGPGADAGGNLGGSSGLATAPPHFAGSFQTLDATLRGRVEGAGANGWLTGGAGGGGGAGTGLPTGGGGGGGGGVLLLAAYRLDCRGEIRAAGGLGGTGQGLAGGGGGGGGGAVLVTYRYRLDDGSGKIHASGGLGGGSESGDVGLAGKDGQVVILRG